MAVDLISFNENGCWQYALNKMTGDETYLEKSIVHVMSLNAMTVYKTCRQDVFDEITFRQIYCRQAV